MSAGSRARLAAASVASVAAFWAGNLYAASLGSLPGQPIANLATAAEALPGFVSSRGIGPCADPGAIATGVVVVCGVWIAWAWSLTREGNYRTGEEHGSAEWGSAREGMRFSDPSHPDDNIILTQRYSMAMSRPDHDPTLERNRNVLVVGGSGSGKTRGFVKPNVMQMNSSYFVTDPKGTLLPEVGPMLLSHGYDVRVFDTVDFGNTMRYNPLAYVRSQAGILEFVECLIANTTARKDAVADPFWENAERLLYAALIGYLIGHCDERDRSLPGLMTLLSLAEPREDDEDRMSPLDVLFYEVESGTRCEVAEGVEPPPANGRTFDERDRGRVRWERVSEPVGPGADFSLGKYHAFKVAAGKTLKSIVISCNARLAALDIAEVRDLLSEDEMGLETLGDPGAKVAVFATMSDMSPTFSFLFAIMMWQTMQVLCERALVTYGGSLPTPVSFILDEFANIERIPNVEKMVAVVRSRNIGVSILLQSMSQLKSHYKDDAQTIVDCCDTMLFLGGKSTETNRDVSESIGKETVSTLTFNESRGTSSTSTRNYQRSERDLMQAAEVGRLDRREAIVLIAGSKPLRDRKYDPDRHPRAGELGSPFDVRAYLAERRRR